MGFSFKEFIKDPVRVGIAGATLGGSELIRSGDIQGNIKELTGQADEERAAKALAEKQEALAQQQLEQQKSDRELALEFAQVTPEELSNIQRLIDQREKIVSKQFAQLEQNEKVLASVDPQIRAAGDQILGLLQGQESKFSEPIRRNRERDRRQLENSLARNLGPGFRTSSAGIAALNQFDDQTSDFLFEGRQRDLSSLLQVSQQRRPDLLGDLGSIAQTESGFGSLIAQAQGNIQGRNIAALTKAPINFAALMGTVGAEQRAQILSSQNTQQNIRDAASLAAMFATSGASVGATGVPGSSGNANVITSPSQSQFQPEGRAQSFNDFLGGGSALKGSIFG